jgi:hypothetical protein
MQEKVKYPTQDRRKPVRSSNRGQAQNATVPLIFSVLIYRKLDEEIGYSSVATKLISTGIPAYIVISGLSHY